MHKPDSPTKFWESGRSLARTGWGVPIQPQAAESGSPKRVRESDIRSGNSEMARIEKTGGCLKVCMEGPVGFEPTTPGLKVRSSTAELRAPSLNLRFHAAGRQSRAFFASPALAF